MSYYSDDITWCDNRKCPVLECSRNLKNRRVHLGKDLYSTSSFEGTVYCIKKTKGSEQNDKTDVN